jgi:hypothetical protein
MRQRKCNYTGTAAAAVDAGAELDAVDRIAECLGALK